MLTLTKNNLADFVKKIKPQFPLDFIKILKIKEQKYSNNNYVFEVSLLKKSGKEKIFIKQSQPYNRRSIIQGKPKKVSPVRIFHEFKMINFLTKIWPKAMVPKIYYFDPKNYIIILSDVSKNKKILIEEFNKNKIYPSLGKLFGFILGKLHGLTYNQKNKWRKRDAWEKRVKYFLPHRYSSALEKFINQKTIDKFYREVIKAKHSLISGDLVYRNIFVNTKTKTPISLIDFEMSVYYDPAFDTGIFLAHYFWMALKGNKKLECEAIEFIKEFKNAYNKEFKKRKKDKELSKIWQRTLKWAGIYLVSRTNGIQGSYFKNHPAWEKRIKQLGMGLFLEKEEKFSKVLL